MLSFFVLLLFLLILVRLLRLLFVFLLCQCLCSCACCVNALVVALMVNSDPTIFGCGESVNLRLREYTVEFV